MRRTLILLLLLAAAGGCRKSESEAGQYEPTRPGYYLFERTHALFRTTAEELWPVLLFARYYAADDAERERLHDTYFYTKRIVRHGDEWRIIDSYRELIVDTGGTALDAENARWSYRYAGRSYPGKQYPVLTTRTAAAGSGHPAMSGSDPGSAGGGDPTATDIGDPAAESGMESPSGTLETTLHLPAAEEFIPSLTGDLRIEYYPEQRQEGPGKFVDTFVIRFTGTATARTEDVEIGCAVDTPLQYVSAEDLFESGAVTLTTVYEGETETASARLLPEGRVSIVYNRHEKEWNYRFPYYYY